MLCSFTSKQFSLFSLISEFKEELLNYEFEIPGKETSY